MQEMCTIPISQKRTGFKEVIGKALDRNEYCTNQQPQCLCQVLVSFSLSF